jgi:hypothetical protein
MIQLLELFRPYEDVTWFILSKFTYDDSKTLRKVCIAFARATMVFARDGNTKWQPFDCLEAALDRLRRRYNFVIVKSWFHAVEQVVRALYALEDQRVIKFHLPHGGFRAMNILGVNQLSVRVYSTYRETMLELVRTHPAFGPQAGPYRFLATNPPWDVLAVLRDIGFCETEVMGTNIIMEPSPTIGGNYWRANIPTELLAQLRVLREGA